MGERGGSGDSEAWRRGRGWWPINDRRIGGRLAWTRDRNRNRIPVPPFPTGTLSGASAPGAVVVPDAVPGHVEIDALRMLLARHEPSDEFVCGCGQPLGEETGLCYSGRQAQKRLLEVMLDRRAFGEDL